MIALPLLHKELIEQAARKRTYVLRVLVALAAGLLFAAVAADLGRYGRSLLGQGGTLLAALVAGQAIATLALIPALVAGSICHEREAGTLELLLLTRLGAWRVVFEKLLARLLPVAGWLLATLPLLAVAYAYGGFSSGRLWASAWVVALGCVQAAAVALAVSAWCRDVAVAVIVSYLLLGIGGLVLPWWLSDDATQAPLLPVMLIDSMEDWRGRRNVASWMQDSVTWAMWESRWALASIPVALVLARLGVTNADAVRRPGWLRWLGLGGRRAAPPPADGTGGRGRRRGRDPLIAAPIAWREGRRPGLANWRVVIALSAVALVPTLIFVAANSEDVSPWRQHERYAVMCGILSGLLLLAVTMQAAGSIGRDRSGQTMEVLLTTPLRAGDLVAGKMRAALRLRVGLSLPLLVLAIGRLAVAKDANLDGQSDHYSLLAMLVAIVLVPAVAAWIGVAMGLLIRSRARAVVAALGVVLAWGASFLLVVAFAFLIDVQRLNSALLTVPIAATPVFLPLINLFGDGDEMMGWPGVPLLVFTVVHAGLWWGLRAWCLGAADRCLRRGAS